MYSLYKKAIRKFVVRIFGARKIIDLEGIPSLVRPHAMFNYDMSENIENKSPQKIIKCISYMYDLMNIENNKIKICEKYMGGKQSYYLNEYRLSASNDMGMQKKALLLLLIDPLEYVRRNMAKISVLNDPDVKAFLLDLKDRAENMGIIHIKWWLIINIDLIHDIKSMVIEQYSDLVLNRNMIREFLMGTQLGMY